MKAPASRLGVPLALLLAAGALLARRGSFADHPLETGAIYVAAGAAWAWALARARNTATNGGLWLVVAGACVLRLLALASDLRTSDDVHRVVWEGAVVSAGSSPYALPPDAPELAALAAALPELHARVNHRDVPATYPPLVQLVGVAAVSVARALGQDVATAGPVTVRGIFAVVDLLALVPLVALLRRRAMPVALALAWGWCPLAAFEVAGAGHLEALALTPLLGALALRERASAPGGPTPTTRRLGLALDAAASALFALAVLAKILPIVLWPWFARGPRRTERTLILVVCVAAACVPFLLLEGAEHGLGGFSEYAFRWEGASLVHRFVEGAWARIHPYDVSWTDPRRLARVVLAAAWLAWAWRTWRRERDPARAALDLFGAWLVVTPVLHPWYALWCVPWLALRRSSACTWLAVASPLLFAPVAVWQRHAIWSEPAWLWPAIALPFAALLARDARAVHDSRRP
jgi:hypothetical protein